MDASKWVQGEPLFNQRIRNAQYEYYFPRYPRLPNYVRSALLRSASVPFLDDNEAISAMSVSSIPPPLKDPFDRTPAANPVQRRRTLSVNPHSIRGRSVAQEDIRRALLVEKWNDCVLPPVMMEAHFNAPWAGGKTLQNVE
eukprot:GEMP01046819.1.p1 GENE.GEMP01046819.1~~GEMP01046819.1.p1  ORF type:complete len:155 (+),score=28.03 GEMP01046819.1:45-467(+)